MIIILVDVGEEGLLLGFIEASRCKSVTQSQSDFRCIEFDSFASNKEIFNCHEDNKVTRKKIKSQLMLTSDYTLITFRCRF